MAGALKEINCFKCRHFHVTWDESFPRGCRALGFKSREMPSAMAYNSSGMECQLYEPREKKPGGGNP